ncbi:uncharacterized protein NEMAJ01_0750 [Nematocida major]|uniref:uncharacterized protein n=1 Tax=Nematocida major TaxID=1912982 RepID=UPI0020080942|nr:uncharacterized protein NEMAJ01_0750 [Nematocida major]KAH9385854.1 hypothetical protein NEMAJ01_0750 [Nematocida major]
MKTLLIGQTQSPSRYKEYAEYLKRGQADGSVYARESVDELIEKFIEVLDDNYHIRETYKRRSTYQEGDRISARILEGSKAHAPSESTRAGEGMCVLEIESDNTSRSERDSSNTNSNSRSSEFTNSELTSKSGNNNTRSTSNNSSNNSSNSELISSELTSKSGNNNTRSTSNNSRSSEFTNSELISSEFTSKSGNNNSNSRSSNEFISSGFTGNTGNTDTSSEFTASGFTTITSKSSESITARSNGVTSGVIGGSISPAITADESIPSSGDVEGVSRACFHGNNALVTPVPSPLTGKQAILKMKEEISELSAYAISLLLIGAKIEDLLETFPEENK